MVRPQRIEYEGAVYHVTARGNERRAIFLDDRDGISLTDRHSMVSPKNPELVPLRATAVDLCSNNG